MLRDHEPIVIEEFNGLFVRGDADSCPPDHSPDLQNVQFIQSGIRTRDGLDTYEAYPKVLRIYTYVYVTAHDSFESLLILTDGGTLYHDKSPTPFTPILTISGMTDFGFVAINGRAYITPFTTVQIGIDTISRGLQNEFIYVYKGDGTPARKAGGTAVPATPPIVLASGAAGNVEAGYHVFAVCFETDTGFLTQLGAFAAINAPGSTVIDISSIPLSPDTFVVARHIVATKAIDPTLFTGNLKDGYQFFFIPGARIADNTTTTYSASFFDSQLLLDASHLLDLFTNIPAGVGLTTYHNRLVSWAEYDNISLARVSYPGEPEAVDQVSGLLVIPLDGNPLTNGHEFRDVLYMFKKTRTVAYNDNGDVPSSWPLTILDQGIGASVHGIATVLDSGRVNIDYLILIDFSGVMLFNGSYQRPELSWKIKDFWFSLLRAEFYNIQIMNDSLTQVLFMTLPNTSMLIGDYSNGMDAKNIRWAKWRFDIQTNTITLIETNKLIIGSRAVFTP